MVVSKRNKKVGKRIRKVLEHVDKLRLDGYRIYGINILKTGDPDLGKCLMTFFVYPEADSSKGAYRVEYDLRHWKVRKKMIVKTDWTEWEAV